jgi:competence protein ComEC
MTGTRSDPNNNSLILRADEYSVRVLLTGDAEIEEQTEVLATVGAAALRADVLKQPHHGSAYSAPAFLAAVQPRVVLVSVGAGNSYGLPSLPTLRHEADGGARIERTDFDGDIAVTRIGGHLAVTYRGHPSGVR